MGRRSSAKNICSVRHRPTPFRAELDGEGHVFGRVGIGANAQTLDIIGPAQQRAELAGHFGVYDFDSAVNDFAERAVQGDRIAFFDRLAAHA